MEKEEFITVYWKDQNRYSILHISKLPNFNSSEVYRNEDIVGRSFEFKWSDGHVYPGEVQGFGTKSAMTIQEEELEKEAVERSFQNHGTEGIESFHALVKWALDGKLSVISSSRLNLDLLKPDEDCVGQHLEGKWKGRWLDLLVLAIGDKEELEGELKSHALAGSKVRKRKDRVNVRKASLEKEVNVDAAANSDDFVVQDYAESNVSRQEEVPAPAAVPFALLPSNSEGEIAELRCELETLKRKCANQEATIKRFRRMLKKGEVPTQATSEMVSIGGGLSIPKEVDDFVKLAFSDLPSKFLKNLVIKGGIFTLEELATHSLKGGRSHRGPVDEREKLDPTKLKISVDYTIACLRLKEDPLKLYKFESSLSNLCTNARKQLKKKQGTEENYL